MALLSAPKPPFRDEATEATCLSWDSPTAGSAPLPTSPGRAAVPERHRLAARTPFGPGRHGLTGTALVVSHHLDGSGPFGLPACCSRCQMRGSPRFASDSSPAEPLGWRTELPVTRPTLRRLPLAGSRAASRRPAALLPLLAWTLESATCLAGDGFARAPVGARRVRHRRHIAPGEHRAGHCLPSRRSLPSGRPRSRGDRLSGFRPALASVLTESARRSRERPRRCGLPLTTSTLRPVTGPLALAAAPGWCVGDRRCLPRARAQPSTGPGDDGISVACSPSLPGSLRTGPEVLLAGRCRGTVTTCRQVARPARTPAGRCGPHSTNAARAPMSLPPGRLSEDSRPSRRDPARHDRLSEDIQPPADSRALLHRRVRCVARPLPVERRPFLPWACFPFEICVPTDGATVSREHPSRSRFDGAAGRGRRHAVRARLSGGRAPPSPKRRR
jgi:hypothetical protein